MTETPCPEMGGEFFLIPHLKMYFASWEELEAPLHISTSSIQVWRGVGVR
jgi:hypothetical protein